jgi:hypothetical protein
MYKVWSEKVKERANLGNLIVDERTMIKMHIREMELENMNWIPLGQTCPMERFCEQGDEPSGPISLGIISPTDNSIPGRSRNHILG